MYKVPTEFYIRMHHVRPRFKNHIEDVLLYMASEICLIGKQDKGEFKTRLNKSIRLFPGNNNKSQKTIDNWRTEISALLGLIEFDENYCYPSKMARILDEEQDLIEFFRFFCFKFQYPGGHLKPEKSLELIKQGVKFKPVPYILRLLLKAKKITEPKFGIGKEEVAHCIFNDLRVVKDNRDVEDTLELILKNRKAGISYDCSGDIVRYAGDILDYMVLANLVDRKPNGKYYIKTHEIEVINVFVNDNSYFSSYDDLYESDDIGIQLVRERQADWFTYVNQDLDGKVFESDITEILKEHAEDELTDHGRNFIEELLSSIREKSSKNYKVKTIEIGNVGEAITIQHEQARLKQLSRDDLAKKVVKMPEALAVGYDIKSYEGVAEIQRFIEVKTTISKNKLNIRRFHMTPNEWGAAETSGDSYFIYRIMISSDDITLFVLRNPKQLYKDDLIAMVPRDGASITYSDKSGNYQKVYT